jgi:hypothetical protein
MLPAGARLRGGWCALPLQSGCHGVAGALGLDAVEQPEGQRGEQGVTESSACSRAWSRCASVACSVSPAACPMLLDR